MVDRHPPLPPPLTVPVSFTSRKPVSAYCYRLQPRLIPEHASTATPDDEPFEVSWHAEDNFLPELGGGSRVKVRKNFVFMWRSRLYTDARLYLEGSSTQAKDLSHEPATPKSSPHRFILVSRSHYHYSAQSSTLSAFITVKSIEIVDERIATSSFTRIKPIVHPPLSTFHTCLPTFHP
jgi:hypothetical protein